MEQNFLAARSIRHACPYNQQSIVFFARPVVYRSADAHLQRRGAICRAMSMERNERSYDTVRRIGAALAAVQVAWLPFSGSSLAELDTATEPAGVGAIVEGSDLGDEDQRSVLAKLKETILPEAKTMLTKVGKGEGSNYPSSIAKELETVELEVNDLINQANKGGDMSNIKSAASGIEQQVNALKAIVGFD